MSSDSWYFLLNGQQHGPVPRTQINTAFHANPGAQILVWQEGMTDWIPFTQIQTPQNPTTYAAPSSALYTPYQSPGFTSGPTFVAPHLQSTNGLAIASLVLGILSIITGLAFLIIPPILAVVFGHLAIGHINRDQNSGGKGMAIAGLIMGYLSILGAILFYLLMFTLYKETKDFQYEQLNESRSERIEQFENSIEIPNQE